MDVTGKHLTEPLIRAWALRKMQEGKEYESRELIEMVTKAHQLAGGLSPSIPFLLLKKRFEAALSGLVEEGWAVEQGWEAPSWILCMTPDGVPSYQEEWYAQEAEVTIGRGPESVYGWYLPTYRELAERKGEDSFPVKVGQTTNPNPYRRIFQHTGTVPEQPKLGFVLKTDNANNWEKWLHSKLRLHKRHIATARGREWFQTTPKELGEIVTAEMVALAKKQSALAKEEGLF